MPIFELPLQIRWSDLDPNFHLRHSVYYDWAAMCRMEFLTRNGLTPALMQQMQFGPIIFREEAVFRKEIQRRQMRGGIRPQGVMARKNLFVPERAEASVITIGPV